MQMQMQIELAPFLEWCAAREAQHARGMGGHSGAHAALLADLSWDGDAGARRLHRWRHESVGGLGDRDVIETALDCAGVALWEVYEDLDEDVAEPTMRWCDHCHESVLVDESNACLWCERPTQAADAKRPFGHCARCDRAVRSNNDGTCWRCGAATGQIPWLECECGCETLIRRFDTHGRRTRWIRGHAPRSIERPGAALPTEPFARYLERCVRNVDPVEAVASQHGIKREEVMAALNRVEDTTARELVRHALWSRGKASLGKRGGWRPDVPKLFDLYPEDARSRVCPGCQKGKAPHAELCKACRIKSNRAGGVKPPATEPKPQCMSGEVLDEAKRLYVVDPSATRVARQLIDRTRYASVASMAASLRFYFNSDGDRQAA
jgi:hypothetical protein